MPAAVYFVTTPRGGLRAASAAAAARIYVRAYGHAAARTTHFLSVIGRVDRAPLSTKEEGEIGRAIDDTTKKGRKRNPSKADENRRRYGGPTKPKFKVGDRVCDKDGGRPGVVSWVGGYTEGWAPYQGKGPHYTGMIEGSPGYYTYKVQEDNDGPRVTRNEINLVRCKAKPKRKSNPTRWEARAVGLGVVGTYSTKDQAKKRLEAMHAANVRAGASSGPVRWSSWAGGGKGALYFGVYSIRRAS